MTCWVVQRPALLTVHFCQPPRSLSSKGSRLLEVGFVMQSKSALAVLAVHLCRTASSLIGSPRWQPLHHAVGRCVLLHPVWAFEAVCVYAFAGHCGKIATMQHPRVGKGQPA